MIGGFLRGEISLTGQEAFMMNLYSGIYKLVIYDYFSVEGTTSQYRLSEFLRISEKDRTAYDSFKINDMKIVLLKGHHIIENLEELIRRLEGAQPPDPRSPIGSLMLFVGNTVKSYDELPECFKKLSALYRERFFTSPSVHVIRSNEGVRQRTRFSSEEQKADFLSELVDDFSSRITIELQTSDRSRDYATIRQLTKKFSDPRLNEVDVRNCSFKLYNNVINNLTQLGINSPVDNVHFMSDTSQIIKSSYLRELEDVMISLAKQYARYHSLSRDSIIDDIIKYVDSFYNENITLEKIAPVFGYNSSYLGKILTKKLGMKLSAYLDTVRIEKAKGMLENGEMQVYRIAELVGYKNVDYFHVKFKKLTGLSPAEYRKNAGGK